jgi:hypothetical protein
MQPHVDFIAALTSEPMIDFVTALSAEQGCDVCHELHASVDELRCAVCEAAICPDCARLRPDTMLSCLRCYDRHPVRVFEPRGGRRSPQQVLAQLREHADVLRDSLAQVARRVRAGEGMLANLRLSVLAFVTFFGHQTERAARAAWLQWRALQPRAQSAYRRARPALVRAQHSALRHGQRIGLQARALRARASAFYARRSAQALTIARARGASAFCHAQRWTSRSRDRVIQGWITLRSFPVRNYATALMVATLILYAVARADHRDA